MSIPTMHPPATPDHRDARAFIRALRLSTTPSHLTPARPSTTSLLAPGASPHYYTSAVSPSANSSQVSSSSPHPSERSMTEDEERAMEAELEHELSTLIQQEDTAEAEDDTEKQEAEHRNITTVEQRFPPPIHQARTTTRTQGQPPRPTQPQRHAVPRPTSCYTRHTQPPFFSSHTVADHRLLRLLPIAATRTSTVVTHSTALAAAAD